jgi:hypothetical protein
MPLLILFTESLGVSWWGSLWIGDSQTGDLATR